MMKAKTALASDTAELTISITTIEDGIEMDGICAPVTDEPLLDPIAEQLLRAGSSHHALRLEGDTVHLELRAARSTAGVDGGR